MIDDVNTADITTKEARQRAAAMVMKLFEHWHLSKPDQLMLLGLAPGSRSVLHNYQHGGAISPRPEMLERVGYLFSIHTHLRTIFPENRVMAYGFMTAKNKEFDNLTPIEVVEKYGHKGLQMIESHLECQPF